MPPIHYSIVTAMERHALDYPDKPAFVIVNESYDRLVLTRQQVWDYSRKYAAVLKKTGLCKGDVVCNTLPNSPHQLICQMGIITSGCVSMGAQNIMVDGSDFIFSLNQGQARAVIFDSLEKNGVFANLKPQLQSYDPRSGEVSCSKIPSLKYVLGCSSQTGCDLLTDLDKEEEMIYEDIAPDEICVLMSTSGSTGVVKLMTFSSCVFLEIGTIFADVLGIKADDVYMNDVDLGWISGFPHIYLATGITRVFLNHWNIITGNTAGLQWQTIVREKCSVCFTIPLYCMEFPTVKSNSGDEKEKRYKLRTIASGGGTVTRKHVEASLEVVADEFVIVYGSTETGLTASKRIYHKREYEEFNVGFPPLGTKVKIVGKDGKEVRHGQVGEIIIQTNQSTRHYVNDSLSSSQTFSTDGWVHLGDVGKVNSNGHLYAMGRNKFAISKGTIVYYPEVIESVFRKCPGVKDIAIVGVPDEKLYEEICALVIKQPNAQLSPKDVHEFCESIINTYDVKDFAPLLKYILFVDSFPHSKRGKLDRKMLRGLACDRLSL